MLDYQALLDLGLSPDLSTLTARAVAAAEAMGFGLVSGVLIHGRFGTPSALVVPWGNPPEAFLASSLSKEDMVRDPLLTRLLAVPGHVTYGEQFYADAGAGDLWDHQAQYGYRSGLSISIHQPSHAEAFLMGVDGPGMLPSDAGSLLRLQAVLQMIALHAQSALQRLVAADAAPEELLPAEKLALQRASATIYGQRGALVEVSRAKGSPLDTAVRKMGANTLPGAILRAIESDLIQR